MSFMDKMKLPNLEQLGEVFKAFITKADAKMDAQTTAIVALADQVKKLTVQQREILDGLRRAGIIAGPTAGAMVSEPEPGRAGDMGGSDQTFLEPGATDIAA